MSAKKAHKQKTGITNKLPISTSQASLLAKVKKLMAGDTSSRAQLLNHLASLIRKEFEAHACSIYMVQNQNQMVLTATDGMNQEAIGKTSVDITEGLIGYVIHQKKPLSISSLAKHPKFIYKPETGEDNYMGGCVCVPLLSDNQAIGTISIHQKTNRKFPKEVVDTLETIAMVVANLEDTNTPYYHQGKQAPESHSLTGLTIHLGLAEGNAYIHKPQFDSKLIKTSNPAREEHRLNTAITELSKDIDKLIDQSMHSESQKKLQYVNSMKDILSTVQLFLNDRGWLNKIRHYIHSGYRAESAVQQSLKDIETRLTTSKDPYLKDRLWDFKDIASRLIQRLTRKPEHDRLIPEGGIIVVADTLGPADLLYYQQYDLRGIVLESGIQTAHVAILAKSLDLPIIGRVTHATSILKTGAFLQLDGRAGTVTQDPNGNERQKFADNVATQNTLKKIAKDYEAQKAITADGIKISLNINAGLLSDLDNIQHMDIDGIGLLRTEIPFMMQDQFPDTAYQTTLYREFMNRLKGKPIKIRTLDIGGDKLLPYFDHVPEDNPMMGWRAIRIALDRPALLRQQIRAIIRAAQGGRIDIMFPMITEVSEYLRAQSLVKKEITRESELGHPTPLDVKYGAMIEVPSLLWRLDQLLPHCDFITVGTNDLFQFTMATDRGNPYTANHFDTLSPAFLTILKEIRQKAEQHNVTVSICGEMASRPLECLVLIALGYRNFSINRSAIGSSVRMIKSTNCQKIELFIHSLLTSLSPSIRNAVQTYAFDNQLQL